MCQTQRFNDLGINWKIRVRIDLWNRQNVGPGTFLVRSLSPGAWQPGSVSSRLMQGEDCSLHLWDDEAGAAVQIIPAAS